MRHRIPVLIIGLIAMMTGASTAQARGLEGKVHAQVSTVQAKSAPDTTTAQAIAASQQYREGNKIVTYQITRYKVGPETLRLEQVNTPEYTGLQYVPQKHAITKIIRHGSLVNDRNLYKTYFTLQLKPGLKVVTSYVSYERHLCKDPKHYTDGQCKAEEQMSTTSTYTNVFGAIDRLYYMGPEGFLSYVTFTLEDPTWNFHWPISSCIPKLFDCSQENGGMK